MAGPIDTVRLRLVPGTTELHEAELAGKDGFAALLGVAVPDDWPPAGTDYDRDAIGHFSKKLGEGGADAIGWYSFFVVTRPKDGKDRTLVANAGYFGPPNEAGTVEIGYSVVEGFRRRGYATEAIGALFRNAFDRGASRVIAHTKVDNAASVALLKKCGFRESATSERPEMLCFEMIR